MVAPEAVRKSYGMDMYSKRY
eukprot:COSAG05_NODE_4341_length_1558_cov_2.359083_2_plen_20_part_01